MNQHEQDPTQHQGSFLTRIPGAMKLGAVLAAGAAVAGSFLPTPGSVSEASASEMPAASSAEGFTATQAATPTVDRLAGVDRYQTAVAISNDLNPVDHQNYGAFIASGKNWVDAVAGGPIAKISGDPLLLTDGTTPGQEMTPATLDELGRIKAPSNGLRFQVDLLGGTSVISDNVRPVLNARGFTYIPRDAGSTRYGTAAAIARDIGPNSKCVVLVDGSGQSGPIIPMLADSAANAKNRPTGPNAGSGICPILLTNGKTMPAETLDWMKDNPPQQVYTVGTKASAAYPQATQKFNTDNVAQLGVDIANAFPSYQAQEVNSNGLGRHLIGIASSKSWADALSGVAHPDNMLATDPDNLSPEVEAFLKSHRNEIQRVAIYGGTAAVSQSVEDAIRRALQP